MPINRAIEDDIRNRQETGAQANRALSFAVDNIVRNQEQNRSRLFSDYTPQTPKQIQVERNYRNQQERFDTGREKYESDRRINSLIENRKKEEERKREEEQKANYDKIYSNFSTELDEFNRKAEQTTRDSEWHVNNEKILRERYQKGDLKADDHDLQLLFEGKALRNGTTAAVERYKWLDDADKDKEARKNRDALYEKNSPYLNDASVMSQIISQDGSFTDLDAREKELNETKNRLIEMIKSGKETNTSMDELIALNEEISKFSDLRAIQNDLIEISNYDLSQDYGTEEQRKYFRDLMGARDDSYGERVGKSVEKNIVNMINQPLEMYDIVKDIGGEIKAERMKKNALQALEKGEIDQKGYEEILADAKELSDFNVYDPENQSQITRQMVQNLQAQMQYGVDGLEKVAVDAVDSAIDNALRVAVTSWMGPGAQIASMAMGGIAVGNENYYALSELKDENGNPKYTYKQIALNSAAKALTEFLTEKCSIGEYYNVMEGQVGKTIFGNVVKNLADKGGVAKYIAAMHQMGSGEFAEEVLGGLLEPQWDRMFLGEPVEYQPGDIMYSGLIGYLSGAGGGVVANTVNVARTVTSPMYIANKKGYNSCLNEVNQYREMLKTATDPKDIEVLQNGIAVGEQMMEEYRSKSPIGMAVNKESDIGEKVLGDREARQELFDALQPTVDAVAETETKKGELTDRLRAMTAEFQEINGIDYDTDSFIRSTPEQRTAIINASNALHQYGIDMSAQEFLSYTPSQQEGILGVRQHNISSDYAEMYVNSEDYVDKLGHSSEEIRSALADASKGKVNISFYSTDAKGNTVYSLDAFRDYMDYSSQQRADVGLLSSHYNNNGFPIDIERMPVGVNGYEQSDGKRAAVNSDQSKQLDLLSAVKTITENMKTTGQNLDSLTSEQVTSVLKDARMNENVFSTASHEAGHYFEGTESFNRMKKLARYILGGEENFNTAMKIVETLYKSSDQFRNGDMKFDAENEVTMLVMQQYADNAEFIKQMDLYDHNVAYRMYRNLMGTLTGNMKTQIQNAYMDAFREAKEINNQGVTGESYGRRYSKGINNQKQVSSLGQSTLKKIAPYAFDSNGNAVSLSDQIQLANSNTGKVYGNLLVNETTPGVAAFGLDESIPAVMKLSVANRTFSGNSNVSPELVEKLVRHPEMIQASTVDHEGIHHLIYQSGNEYVCIDLIPDGTTSVYNIYANKIDGVRTKTDLNAYLKGCEQMGYDILSNKKEDNSSGVYGMQAVSSLKVSPSNPYISQHENEVNKIQQKSGESDSEYINRRIGENESFQSGTADKTNYQWHTDAIFEEINALPKELKDLEPDYISRSGSRYFYTDEGVYRISDHWGLGVGDCNWILDTQTQSEMNGKDRIGFAKWSNFVQNPIRIETNPLASQEGSIKTTGITSFDNIHVEADRVYAEVDGKDYILKPSGYWAEFTPQTIDSEMRKTVKYSLTGESLDSSLPLDQRVSGDELLNAQDRIEELRSNGADIDENGYVTLYHRSTQDNIDNIRKTGKMNAKEDGLFFSTSRDGSNNTGYGDSVLELKVPVEDVEIDDVFGDEASVRIPLGKKRSLDVTQYLQNGSDDSSARKALHKERAIEEYGTTYDYRKAAYILDDGQYLDFSYGQNSRAEDHRSISSVFDEDYDTATQYLTEFMNEGNIRILPEAGGIDISNANEPTEKQYRKIGDYLDHFWKDGSTLDITDENGNTVASIEYPPRTSTRKIVGDIRQYYADGTVPSVNSNVNQFRYSLTPDGPLTPEGHFGYEPGESKPISRFDSRDLALFNEALEEGGYDTVKNLSDFKKLLSRYGYTGTENRGTYNKETPFYDAVEVMEKIRRGEIDMKDPFPSFEEERQSFVSDLNERGMEVTSDDLDRIIRKNPVSPKTLQAIERGKQIFIDNASKWIPDYDVIRGKYDVFSDKTLNDALYQSLMYGDIDDTTKAQMARELMSQFGFLSPEMTEYAETEAGKVVDDMLSYFALDAEYKANAKNIDPVAKRVKDVLDGFAEATDIDREIEIQKKAVEAKKAADEYKDSLSDKDLAHELISKGKDLREYGFQTIQQVFDHVADGDNELRTALRNTVELSKDSADMDYNRRRSEAQTLIDQMKDLGITGGSEESSLLQAYMEKHTNERENGTWKEFTEEDLKKEAGDSYDNIKKAADLLKKAYDKTILDLNMSQFRIYGDVLADNQYETAKLKAKLEQASRTVEILEEKMRNSPDEHTQGAYSKAVKRYNQLINQFNAKTESDVNQSSTRRQFTPYRQNYSHHVAKNTFFGNLKNAVKGDGVTLPTALSGISENTRPNTAAAGFMWAQEGGDYVMDGVESYAQYINDAARVIAYNDYIAEIRQLAKDIRAESTGTELSHFVSYLDEYANDMAGKRQAIDRALDKMFPRAMKVTRALVGQAKKAALMFNARSALVQFANIPNGMGILEKNGGAQFGVDMLRGMKDYGNTLRSQEARDVMNQSRFLTSRFFDFDTGRTGVKATLNNIADTMMTKGDEVGTKIIWWSAYEQGVRKGVQDPIFYADDLTRRSVAGRGVGEVPYALKGSWINAFFPFQVETNNAWQTFKQEFKGKNAGALATTMVASYLFNAVFRKLVGDDVLPEFLSPLIDAFKRMGDEDDDKEDLLEQVVFGELGEFISMLPGGSFAVSLGTDKDNSNKIFGDYNPSRYGFTNLGIKGVADLATDVYNQDWRGLFTDMIANYAPGGKQLTRSVGGLQSMGVLPTVDSEGNLNFSSEEKNKKGQVKWSNDTSDPFEYLKAALFGKWATTGARDYIESGFKAQSNVDTKLYKALEDMGLSHKEAREFDYSGNASNKEAYRLRNYLESKGLWDEFYSNLEKGYDDYVQTVPEGEKADSFTKYANQYGMTKGVMEGTYEPEVTEEPEQEMKTEESSASFFDWLFNREEPEKTQEAPEEPAETVPETKEPEVKETPAEKKTSQYSSFYDAYKVDEKSKKSFEKAMDLDGVYKDSKGNITDEKAEGSKKVANSEALETRKALEDMGQYENVLDYIAKNGLDYKDFGLTKTVAGYSDSKFRSKYENVFGSWENPKEGRSSGNREYAPRTYQVNPNYGKRSEPTYTGRVSNKQESLGRQYGNIRDDDLFRRRTLRSNRDAVLAEIMRRING